MNRAKKEALRKQREAREGRTDAEIVALDREEEIRAELERRAQDRHFELFPEEYDFTQDSYADACDRQRGINPMSAGYTEEVNARRDRLGAPPLSESGMGTGSTLGRCQEEVFRQWLCDERRRIPPADQCLLCEKRLHEMGGVRLVATNEKYHVGLSGNRSGGGNPESPYRSKWLFQGRDTWVVIRGPNDVITDEIHEQARQTFLSLRHPWFCQLCAQRQCSQCGEPMNRPPAADVIRPTGCISHISILPVDLGCINKDCSRYQEEW